MSAHRRSRALREAGYWMIGFPCFIVLFMGALGLSVGEPVRGMKLGAVIALFAFVASWGTGSAAFLAGTLTKGREE